MASRPNIGGGASVPLPLALIAQAIPKLTRHELASLTERLIDRLDELEPYPDDEDGDVDYCTASDDRGTIGPPVRSTGFGIHPTGWDEDDELPEQPVSLNAD